MSDQLPNEHSDEVYLPIEDEELLDEITDNATLVLLDENSTYYIKYSNKFLRTGIPSNSIELIEEALLSDQYLQSNGGISVLISDDSIMISRPKYDADNDLPTTLADHVLDLINNIPVD